MGWMGIGCAVYFLLFQFFLTVIATDTECQGNGEVSSLEVHPGIVVLVAVLDAPTSSSALFSPLSVAFTVAVAVSFAVTIAAAVVSSTGPFS